MLLKIKRSQAVGITKSVTFAIDARLQLSAEEEELVRKYRLGSLSLYNSRDLNRNADAATAHAEASQRSAFSFGGVLAAFWHFCLALFALVFAKLSVKVSINSLTSGQHIACKSLEELIDAENIIHDACAMVVKYLGIAKTFDGREVLVEF
jgi:hypothetical protein